MLKSLFVLLISCILFVSAKDLNCLFCSYKNSLLTGQRDPVAYAQSIAVRMSLNMGPDHCTYDAVKTDGAHHTQLWIRFACSSTTKVQCMDWSDNNGQYTQIGGFKIACGEWPRQ
ncbi:uncharacterized protein MELLADRAFT_106145 [Melampsora larici-populina 98AG31]|uniref:Secreted protein n=1 Tax=Melampsora larici-populina (strain 98AG31 / pathotype 3-4-7) TaxID=747676 RepID=F4RKJ3_MELLP|nr:uncharacterized protein MELLADRAFT_106145 [Melampsora larici-populina 98AG31]EGG07169.1 secreted protein [Melampsora larici-populina 98AG31]